jgi:tRNA(Ile)-lysidine synthase
MVFLEEVVQTINEYKMLNYGDAVLVGVSGGPDSVALLHVLNQLSRKMDLSLHVAHLNHKLRGREADQDARFVKGLAQKLGVPFIEKQIDVAALARQNKMTLEEAAREIRYDFLESAAKEHKAGKIALGHNADDEVETVMMWLLRGTGRTGLTGIPPARKLPASGIQIIRPLIGLHRKQILAYLKKHRLSFCLDRSNLNPAFMRNKIRLKLLPLIRKEYSPNFNALILQTARIMRDENKWLDKEVDKALKLVIKQPTLTGNISIDLNRFLRYNIGLQRQILRRSIFLLSSGQVLPDYRKVEEIITLASFGKTNARLALAGGLTAKKSYGILEIGHKKEANYASGSFSYGLKIPGMTYIPSLDLSVKTSIFDKPKNFKYSRSRFCAHLDYGKIDLPLVIRNRYHGDRINPLGMRGYKKIKDVLIDNKIPQEKRDTIPLIVSGTQVLWMTGYPSWEPRISDKVKVTGATKKILEIKLISKKQVLGNR